LSSLVDQQQQDDDWYLIGIITAPFGLRGEVRVEVITEFPQRFKRMRTVYLGPEHRPVVVEGAKQRTGAGIALKLAGYETAEATEPLRGTHLYVPQRDTVPLAAGRYYVDQIVGLQARTVGGAHIGSVREVLATGSNDVYIIDAGSHGEILVPAIRSVVTEINIAAGYLVITPMPGLLPPGMVTDAV